MRYLVEVLSPKVLTVGIASKAALMGSVVSALDIGFVKSLVLILVSAFATGIFGVAVAWIQKSETRELREALDRLEGRQVDIAGAVGARKRDTDEPHGGPEQNA